MNPAPTLEEWVLAHIRYSDKARAHGESKIPTLTEMQRTAYGRAVLHCLIMELRTKKLTPAYRYEIPFNRIGRYRSKKPTGLDNKMRAAGERDED